MAECNALCVCVCCLLVRCYICSVYSLFGPKFHDMIIIDVIAERQRRDADKTMLSSFACHFSSYHGI